jgi:hypothetical protein
VMLSATAIAIAPIKPRQSMTVLPSSWFIKAGARALAPR